MKFFQLISLAALALTSSAFLMPGTQAPDFKNVDALLNLDKTKVSLDDFKGKYLVIIFYPGDFSNLDPFQMTQINDNLGSIASQNSAVIAVSSDKVSTHLNWAKTTRQKGGVSNGYLRTDIKPNLGLDFHLLSDTDQSMMASYGAIIDNRRCTSNLARQTTCNRCCIQTGNQIQSGIVIIDPTQTVRYVNFNDANVARNNEELVSIISNLKSGEKSCKAKKEFEHTHEPKAVWGEGDYLHMLNEGTGVIPVPTGATVKYRLKAADFERGQYDENLHKMTGNVHSTKLCIHDDKTAGCLFATNKSDKNACLMNSMIKMVKGQVAIMNCSKDSKSDGVLRWLLEIVSWKVEL